MSNVINFNDEKMIRACYNAKKRLDDHGDGAGQVIHVMEWQQEQKDKVEKAFDDVLKTMEAETLAIMVEEGWASEYYGNHDQPEGNDNETWR